MRSPRGGRLQQSCVPCPASASSPISSGCPRSARSSSGMPRRATGRGARQEVAVAATFDRPSVSTELARAIIGAAERKAQEMGHPFVIAIVDDSGVLKAFSRMDGAALLSVQIAQDKAYTPVRFCIPTDAWHEFVKDDPPLPMGAAPGIDRLIVFAAGFPLTIGGSVVRAIRGSGSPYPHDLEVAPTRLPSVP